jgi:hypothetical protein
MHSAHPQNVFVLDEAGDNTNGKNDKNNAGEKKMVGKGMVPKSQVGIKGNHFTIVPVSNLRGDLCLITVIFAGESMKAEWCLGIDVLAEDCTVDEGLYTFGAGKVFPGGPSCYVDGKEIPCYCTCTPNASTDDTTRFGSLQRGVNTH